MGNVNKPKAEDKKASTAPKAKESEAPLDPRAIYARRAQRAKAAAS
ncbi:hypothetical protein [Brevundimonas sp. MYb52]|nr:hypothetical protein [Brevundimonas sp. MYb52]